MLCNPKRKATQTTIPIRCLSIPPAVIASLRTRTATLLSEMPLELDDLLVSELTERVGGRLLRVESPLAACVLDPEGAACRETLDSLRNPFYIEDQPGGFHTTGWLGAYDAEPSPYAVAAESAEDVAAAVVFAHEHGLRVVVKGTGHDYLGRSASAESLMLWTRRMSDIRVHDSFVPAGSAAEFGEGVPAVTLGAGVRWLDAYQVLATYGRYVQGGGCTSVGATGGFTQGGGFGSFSRRFGTAAGNVLEMEVVTASGDVLVVNATRHPELFWALRGGGGGTFGVVSKVTMRTHPPPATLGTVSGTIRAARDEDFRALIERLVALTPSLCDAHWGEQIRLNADNTAEFSLLAPDLSDEEAHARWDAFLDWVATRPGAFDTDVFVAAIPFYRFWDPAMWDELVPEMISRDERPDAPPGRFWWATNQEEVSHYLNAFSSRWLPERLFTRTPERITEALFEATRHWNVSLHFNKALSGALPEAVARDRATSINPAVFDAACLLITASHQLDVFPGVVGREPDLRTAATSSDQVRRAMEPIRTVTPTSGSYVNETDYFEPDWQQSFWGDNYPRLLAVKRQYDPTNLFRVHHGVGGEDQGS
jgi:FAD/FMN-containing dehydrogenase